MPSIDRCFRILGLPPGASQEEIKRAYRDMAQVWHPDRFAHDDRLRKKAQDNLKRINEAYEILKSHQPAPEPATTSRLSQTYNAIIGLGDFLKSDVLPGRPSLGRRPPVVGLGTIEATGVYRVSRWRRRRRRLRRHALAITLIAAVIILGAVLFLR